ncbi:hypothetical protein EW146_g8613 [Bondarzewia mesenterica]|uniref:Cytosol aminopeptidase domain-containing protein n=1 Tax=Bondarzewia mesenterica TaxID=1095465 RepID=A0A4S4LDH0_9AGAM|nr:hypothetical protein EW146_g8613 [Bondarzewia mesenterica]
MLLRRGASSFLHRSPISFRSMYSTAVFILPVDPKGQAGSQVVPNVDPLKLWSTTPAGSKAPKTGSTRIFYNTPAGEQSTNVTAVVSLGEGFDKKKGDARKEIVRKAVGSGVKQVKELGDGEKKSPSMHRPILMLLVSVAAYLADYKFTLKTSPPSSFKPNSEEAVSENVSYEPLQGSKEWDTGVIYAKAQNFARTLMELPANMLTPTAFTERIKAEFANVADTKIIVRDEAWAAEQGMNTFLSVTKGTSEPAKFLEMFVSSLA